MSTFEPIPGDPGALRRGARDYARTAEALEEAAAAIRSLAGQQDADSQAVSELTKTATQVADRLGRLQDRYTTAGSELVDYADVLSEAQDAAAGAESARSAAAGSLSAAEANASSYETQARLAQDPTAATEALESARYWNARATELGGDVSAAQTRHAEALSNVERAAQRASTAIAAAVESDGLNDSGWDKFTNWISEHADVLKKIKEVLSWVASIAAVIAIFAGPLAPVFLAIAAVAAGLAAVVSLGLALAGEISWYEFGLDAIGALTFGVGAIATRGLRITMGAIKQTRYATSKVRRGSWVKAWKAVDGEWDRLAAQASKLPNKSLKDRVTWLASVKSHKTVDNKVAAHILQNAKTGAGGKLDADLVKRAQAEIVAIRRMPLVGLAAGAPEHVNTAAESALAVADVFGVSEASKFRVAPTVVSNGYEKIFSTATTRRVWSEW